MEKNSFSLFETLLALVIVSILATSFTQLAQQNDTRIQTISNALSHDTFYTFFIHNNEIKFTKGSGNVMKTSYEQTTLNLYRFSFPFAFALTKRHEVFK